MFTDVLTQVSDFTNWEVSVGLPGVPGFEAEAVQMWLEREDLIHLTGPGFCAPSRSVVKTFSMAPTKVPLEITCQSCLQGLTVVPELWKGGAYLISTLDLLLSHWDVEVDRNRFFWNLPTNLGEYPALTSERMESLIEVVDGLDIGSLLLPLDASVRSWSVVDPVGGRFLERVRDKVYGLLANIFGVAYCSPEKVVASFRADLPAELASDARVSSSMIVEMWETEVSESEPTPATLLRPQDGKTGKLWRVFPQDPELSELLRAAQPGRWRRVSPLSWSLRELDLLRTAVRHVAQWAEEETDPDLEQLLATAWVLLALDMFVQKSNSGPVGANLTAQRAALKR